MNKFDVTKCLVVRALFAIMAMTISSSGTMANQKTQQQPPIVNILSTPPVLEGGSVEIRVSLDRPAEEEVNVLFFTQSLSAIGGRDFFGFSQTVNFAPGEELQSVYLFVLDDGFHEETESMAVRITNPQGARLGNARSVITILDDDVAVPTTVKVNSESLFEWDTTRDCAARVGIGAICPRQSSIRLAVEGTNEDGIEVTMFSTEGTAQRRRDYFGFSQRVVIPPNVYGVTVPVDLIDNDFIGTRHFFVRLANPEGADLAQPGPTRIDIVDDDRVPKIWIQTNQFIEGELSSQIEVRLDRPADVDIKAIVYTTGGSFYDEPEPAAEGGGRDYQGFTREIIVPAGDVSTKFDIVIVDDDTPEPDELFSAVIQVQGGAASTSNYGGFSLMRIIDND